MTTARPGQRGIVLDASAVVPWFVAEQQTLFEDAPLFGRSLDLSEQTGHALYDCIYLVPAMREDAALATFDRRLAGVARRLSISLWAAEDPTR